MKQIRQILSSFSSYSRPVDRCHQARSLKLVFFTVNWVWRLSLFEVILQEKLQSNQIMKTISHKEFSGERPLFGSHGLRLENVIIHEGESALKECSDIVAENCRFEGMYPFWHVNGFRINKCFFSEGVRAALWYSSDLLMTDTLIDAPKMFREMHNLRLEDVRIPAAQETLWHCSDIILRRVEVSKADYIFFHCENIDIDGYSQQGKYSFQYCRNVVIRNAKFDTKDAFWNTENVTVYDSVIKGEYLGWHSKNLRLVNCHISGTQPLCYAENLVLENCTFGEDADLAFEYSSVRATVKGNIPSVKNPQSGCITADSIGEIIIDENVKSPADCVIKTE